MMKRGPTDHHTPNQDCSNCGQLGHPWFTCLHIICDGCNQHGHIYRHCWDRIHRQEQLVHPKAIITTEDDHHALDTPEIDMMTEAAADQMLGCTQETEVQVTQDTQHRQTHQQGQEPKMKAHAGLQPSSKPITPQTAVK